MIGAWSAATLVLETQNSTYVIEIGRSYSSVTCVKGTLVNQVRNEGLAELTDEIQEQWDRATGFADLESGPDPDTATKLAEAHFVGSQAQFKISSGGTLDITRIKSARWMSQYIHREPEPIRKTYRVVDFTLPRQRDRRAR